MEEISPENRWPLDESRVVKPFKRYKAMRNNSMPDLHEHSPPNKPHAERQFIYNKWFIQPEERLKLKPQGHRSSLQLDPTTPFFYESLYRLDLQSTRPAKQNQQKQAAIRRICADGQNLKLLATFRNRKQQHSKRVPAVVDYIMDFHRKQQQQQRDRLTKRSKYFY